MLEKNLKDAIKTLDKLNKNIDWGAIKQSELAEVAENVDRLEDVFMKIKTNLIEIEIVDRRENFFELLISLMESLLVLEFTIITVTDLLGRMTWHLGSDKKIKLKDSNHE